VVESAIGCVIGVGLEIVDVVTEIEIVGVVVASDDAVKVTDDDGVVIDVLVMGSVSVFVKKMGIGGDGVAICVLVKETYDDLLARDCADHDVGMEIRAGVEAKVNGDDHHVYQRGSEMIQN